MDEIFIKLLQKEELMKVLIDGVEEKKSYIEQYVEGNVTKTQVWLPAAIKTKLMRQVLVQKERCLSIT